MRQAFILSETGGEVVVQKVCFLGGGVCLCAMVVETGRSSGMLGVELMKLCPKVTWYAKVVRELVEVHLFG